jgi:hypothetical protein
MKASDTMTKVPMRN